MGKKLKAIAVIILILELFAVIFYISTVIYNHSPSLRDILILVGAGFAVFVQFIMLYCIGETEDKCSSILSGVDEMQKKIENLEKEIYTMNNDKIKIVYKNPESTQNKKIHGDNASKTGGDAVTPLKGSEEDYIYCPKCGLKQKSTETICKRCSTKFE